MCLCGCQTTKETKKKRKTKTTRKFESTTIEADLYGFEKADYEEFNSLAKDNGLGETPNYFDGVVGDVRYAHTDASVPGSKGIYLSVVQEDEKEWLVFFEAEPLTNRESLDSMIGRNVRVFGCFGDLSIAYEEPVVSLYYDKCHIEDLDNEEIFTYEDFTNHLVPYMIWFSNIGFLNEVNCPNNRAVHFVLSRHKQ